MNPRAQDLTQGSVSRHLFRLSVPMIWGILAVVSMQVADVYFIAGLGHTELEAISFTFPVSMVIFNLMMGLPIATSAICARLIGQKATEGLKHFVAHTLVVSAIFGIVIAVLGEILMPLLFPLLGATDAHMPLILSFMRISLWGYMFVIIPMVANAALRAAGDSFVPSLIMVGSALINIPLSWALVYGHFGFPALGMPGAAIANIASYSVSALCALYVVIVRHRMLDGHSFTISDFASDVRRLMTIAAPVGIMNLIQPLSVAVITAMLAGSGAAAVAAYGIIGRIEALATVALMAVAIGMGPIIGQNYGAKRWDRIEETITVAIRFCIWWSCMIGVALMATGHWIATEFSANPATVHIAATYFIIVGITGAIGNVAVGWGSAWNALARPQYSALITFGRFVVGTMLCGYIGHLIGGWAGLFWGIALGNLGAGIALHFWSLAKFKALQSAR